MNDFTGPSRAAWLAFWIAFGGLLMGAEVQDQTAAVPTITSTTQLIQIVVTASDNAGFPVEDLTRTDFHLIESGKERTIAVFKKPANAHGNVDVSSPRFGRFSNISGIEEADNINVLLLDQADTEPRTWAFGWAQVLRFLRSLHAADHMAVYLLTASNGLQIVQDYKDNIGPLLTRLQHLAHPTLLSLLAPSQPEHLSLPSFAKRDDELEMPELLSLGRIYGLSDAFQVIADHLIGIPGTKSLIWFGGNFPNAFQHDNRPPLKRARVQLLRTVNHLISANVSIYPVDARGLMPDHVFDVENEQLPIAALDGPTAPYPFPEYNFLPLLDYARQSGGEACFNTNGLVEAIRKASFQGFGRYVLGFYVSGGMDNKFHRIKVESIKPNVHLKYRPGYWALVTEPVNDRRLEIALSSPFTAEGIQLQADAAVTARGQMVLQIYSNPQTITANRDNEELISTIDIIFGQKDAVGRVFAVPPYRVPILFSQSTLASHTWLTTRGQIALRTQSTTVRIVIRDDASGRIGSLDIPIKDALRQ